MEYSEAALQKVREDRLLINEVDRWLYDEIAPYIGDRVLEVGCGMGNFAHYLTDRELYVGTDISAESVAHVQELYGNYDNIRATVCDVTSAAFTELARYKVDTVFSLNVFEHIDDHLTAVKHVQHVLQPGGHFILVVPAHKWLYGSIDLAIGHYRRYDKEMAAGLLAQAGFDCLMQKHINALGALGWFANGRLRKQETPPASQLRMINRIVPWLRRFERVTPVPFGISLMVVAQKPS